LDAETDPFDGPVDLAFVGEGDVVEDDVASVGGWVRVRVE
jgi:hypothetical protein